MSAAATVFQGDTVEHTAVFALELLDPVTLRVVSRGLNVSAAGLAWSPRLNRSGRWVWIAASPSDPAAPTAPAVPTSISVSPQHGSGYSSWTYDAAAIAAGISKIPGEGGLCRLYLLTAPDYDIPTGVTAVRGRLRRVPDVNGQPPSVLPGAKVWLQWQIANANPPATFAGPPSTGAQTGDFAATVLFPTKASGSVPATAANGDLILILYVAQPDGNGGWSQAHTAASLNGSRSGQILTLPDPIAWSTLTPG